MSAPLLRRTSGPVRGALEQAEQSRHEPVVVRRHHDEPTSGRDERVSPEMEKLVGRAAARQLRQAPNPARHPRPY